MNVRSIVRNAPNSVILICGTVMTVSVLGAYVFLAHSGKDAAEVSRFVNTLLNFAALILTSLGVITAGSAAKTSEDAKNAAEQAASQTNGALDARIQQAILSALGQQEAANAAERENPAQGRLL